MEDRYENARAEKKSQLFDRLRVLKVNRNNFSVYIRAFKKEEILEIWVCDKDQIYKLFSTYSFCTSSGELGPKRKEGDHQIPEGIYHVNLYNPESKFHLSLGLNYPNKSDLIFADVDNPGSDIFIHGGCSSVGCISITDDKIKELYVLSSMAKSNMTDPIRVDIYPFQFTYENNRLLHHIWKENVDLWLDLKKIYDKFQRKKILTPVIITEKGRYQLNEDH